MGSPGRRYETVSTDEGVVIFLLLTFGCEWWGRSSSERKEKWTVKFQAISHSLTLISSFIKSVIWNLFRTPAVIKQRACIRSLQVGISSLFLISCVALDMSLIYNSETQFSYEKKWKYQWLSHCISLAVAELGQRLLTWSRWKHFHNARYTAGFQ